MRSWGQRQAGASAVEFALLLPVFLVLIFGLIYGALALHTKITLTQAAREGARYAATLPMTDFGGPSPSTGLPPAGWQTAVMDRAEEAAFGDNVGPHVRGNRFVCVRFVTNAGATNLARRPTTAPCPASPASVPGQRVEVLVGRPVAIDLIVFPEIPMPSTSSASIARYEVRLP